MRAPRTRRSLRSLAAVVALTVTTGLAACGSGTSTTSSGSSTSTAAVATTTASDANGSETTSSTTTAATASAEGGPGNAVDVTSVSTVAELDALIQEAYGEASLGLHRGHQPVESVLDETLGISHEELHVRMEAGQNLATIADDVGVGSDALIAALVESWSPAIDTLEQDGTITADQADAYRQALQDAFTFKVTWDGETATPTFAGIA